MYYPGAAGHLLSSSNPWGIQNGSWQPIVAGPGGSSKLTSAMTEDINYMESSNWIDHLTSLVTLEIGIWYNSGLDIALKLSCT